MFFGAALGLVLKERLFDKEERAALKDLEERIDACSKRQAERIKEILRCEKIIDDERKKNEKPPLFTNNDNTTLGSQCAPELPS